MAATIISNSGQYTFGMMTNRMISGLISANTSMERLADAIATASSGFDGTPGTQFEISANAMPPTAPNLFGVLADSATPGAKGSDYSYAMNQLNAAWKTFWTAAQPFVEQLDNGNPSM